VFVGNLYGVYDPGKTYIRKLETQYNNIVRKVFRITRSISIGTVFQAAKMPNFDDMLRQAMSQRRGRAAESVIECHKGLK
jgi:hypothetical protein